MEPRPEVIKYFVIAGFISETLSTAFHGTFRKIQISIILLWIPVALLVFSGLFAYDRLRTNLSKRTDEEAVEPEPVDWEPRWLDLWVENAADFVAFCAPIIMVYLIRFIM